MPNRKKIKIGIIGATGYTGVELLRLLSAHPYAEVCAVTSRSEAGVKLADYFPACAAFTIWCLRSRKMQSWNSAIWCFSPHPTALP